MKREKTKISAIERQVANFARGAAENSTNRVSKAQISGSGFR
jgi:hypothetical protein